MNKSLWDIFVVPLHERIATAEMMLPEVEEEEKNTLKEKELAEKAYQVAKSKHADSQMKKWRVEREVSNSKKALDNILSQYGEWTSARKAGACDGFQTNGCGFLTEINIGDKYFRPNPRNSSNSIPFRGLRPKRICKNCMISMAKTYVLNYSPRQVFLYELTTRAGIKFDDLPPLMKYFSSSKITAEASISNVSVFSEEEPRDELLKILKNRWTEYNKYTIPGIQIDLDEVKKIGVKLLTGGGCKFGVEKNSMDVLVPTSDDARNLMVYFAIAYGLDTKIPVVWE